MTPSRSILGSLALTLVALGGFAVWHVTSTSTGTPPPLPAPPASTSQPAPSAPPVPEAEAGPPWGVVGTLPCHGNQLLASGSLLYGCRDRINADTGRIAHLGTFGDGAVLPDGELIVAVSGDHIVHGGVPLWRVSRLSTGELVQEVTADTPVGRSGDTVWWTRHEGGAVGLHLASLARIEAPLGICTFGVANFDRDGELACLQRDQGDDASAAGRDRIAVLQNGTVRWLRMDGTEDATLEPLTGVEEFGVADATDERVLAWSVSATGDRYARRWFVLARDSATGHWQRHNLPSEAGLTVGTIGALLPSGRVAVLSGDDVVVLAENGESQTPVAPAATSPAGMLPLTTDAEGVWRNGPYEVQPDTTPSAVFVLPASPDNDQHFVTVTFLHRSLFADLAEAELNLAIRNAVLPNGTDMHVRTWRRQGERRWRMQAVMNDCYYDAVALDVLERGDFFEVRETHLGTRCREVEGARAEACRNANEAFGAVPPDAASLEGLDDVYAGDASLSP